MPVTCALANRDPVRPSAMVEVGLVGLIDGLIDLASSDHYDDDECDDDKKIFSG